MAPVERRRLWFQVVLGLLLTVLAVTVEYAGFLVALERGLYDWRVRHFQRFATPPTDQLVHLDITDADLTAIGEWPWQRWVIAEVLDELTLAGTKAVGFDILFTPQGGEGQDAGTRRAYEGYDRELVDAIGRHGRVVSALALSWDETGPRPPGADELYKLLTADLELERDQAAERLRALGVPEEVVTERAETSFVATAERAMRAVIVRELESGRRESPAELRRRLLPNTDPALTDSALITRFGREYARAEAILAVRRFARPIDPGRPRALAAGDGLIPTPSIMGKLAGIGFAAVVDDDPVVRSVPLWVTYRNRLLPQFGFALACAALDVKPADARLEAGYVVLPKSDGGEARIPVQTRHFKRLGEAGYMMDVPWLGSQEWETMYDFPAHRRRDQHMTISSVWALVRTRNKINRNNASLDKAIGAVQELLGDERAVLPVGHPGRDQQIIGLAGLAADEYGPPTKELAEATEALVKIPTLQATLDAELAAGRRNLREQLKGKTVLVGWTATGQTDLYPTPLHVRCPGAVVHGAVFNAITTGAFWHRAPDWVTPVFTAIVGLLATAFVALMRPVAALLSVLVLGAAVTAVNALAFFDYGDMIVNLAGPLVSAGLVWTGVTLLGFVTEVAERGRITRRFRAYVDPTLVNYVLEHPDQAAFEGHERELTVVFTDLKGFTALSEVLRGRVVRLLGRYIELMVPVIRRHNGYVNKFLGDGIMCFFGAPADNPRHAIDAVEAVLEMQGALQPLNEELEAQGLATMSMRAGVSTGAMFVGDAGPSFASEFTVIGDRVNLGSRLESANKATGTRNLVTARTVEMIGDAYLCRPVAKLKVVGKVENEVVYEVLCRASEADDRAHALVRLTRAMFDAFQAGDLDRCRAAIEDLEREFGPDTLADLYRDHCNRGRDATQEWDGEIALTEK